MNMLPPPHVAGVLRRLRDAGHAAYAVGGCVRDCMMGLAPVDYDVATSATPEEILRVFAGERVVETGVKHGTVTVLTDGAGVEVTTFRVDGTYSDARRPDAVTFTPSLPADLARRDFTVNAMAYDEREGLLIDPYGGAADVERRVIRCVGDPDTRFQEDALRILRALRFAAVLDFSIEAETAAALRRNAPLLEMVSAERVNIELCKLLCGKNARAVLLEYGDVLGVPIPEILPMQGFDQHNPYHIYDVWGHTAAAVGSAPPAVVLRLAALLHDVGKPPTFTLDEGGGHFYGHAKQSAEMADAILRRLRFDTATRERVVLLVREHCGFELTERAVKRALNRLGPEAYFELAALMRADNLAQSPALRHRQAWIDEMEQLGREILEQEACFSLKDLSVRGDDLIAAGYAPGPALGAALKLLLDAVIDGRAANEKAALLAYLEMENGQ